MILIDSGTFPVAPLTGPKTSVLVLDERGWIAMAARAFMCVAAHMSRGERLGHSWRDQRLLFPGLASDHAAKVAKCSVCGGETTTVGSEPLCWVCRRLKISAWREIEQQMPAQE